MTRITPVAIRIFVLAIVILVFLLPLLNLPETVLRAAYQALAPLVAALFSASLAPPIRRLQREKDSLHPALNPSEILEFNCSRRC